MVALFDAHFFWTLCECHMFEFDLCECEHKRQHQIYFTSCATTMRGACEYQTHTGEKSNKCNQYGATTIREYRGEYQTSQAASRAPTIKRSLPILGFCINQHNFLHPGGTIVEIISYTNMNNVDILVASPGSPLTSHKLRVSHWRALKNHKHKTSLHKKMIWRPQKRLENPWNAAYKWGTHEHEISEVMHAWHSLRFKIQTWDMKKVNF